MMTIISTQTSFTGDIRDGPQETGTAYEEQ
jgi:hypothetical protein